MTGVGGRRQPTQLSASRIRVALPASLPAAIDPLGHVLSTAPVMEGVVSVNLSPARRQHGTVLTSVWATGAASDASSRTAREERCSLESPSTASLTGAEEGVNLKAATSPLRVDTDFAYLTVEDGVVQRKDVTEL